MAEQQTCLRCRKTLEEGAEMIAVFVFAQTVGMRPRLKARAYRVAFCPPCGVSTAMGPSPETTLNIAAYNSLRDLIGDDKAVTDRAWRSLNERVNPQTPMLTAGDVVDLPLPTTQPFGVAARAAG